MERKESIDNLYMKVKTTLGFDENFEFGIILSSYDSL
jgi:hypothetical protein